MFNKKLMLITIFLVGLLAVGAVSAADNTTDMIGEEPNTDLVSPDTDDVLTAGEKSFADLNRTINANRNGEVYLDSDYKYSSGDDSFDDGIVIDRDVTIYGNGHVINGSNEARIFKINSENVVFYNITFVNANANNYPMDSGGAINGGGRAINCTFKENHANYNGGAIHWGFAINCTFSDNHAGNAGGAMWGGSARDCTFTGNAADYGGAMYEGSARDCTFTGNAAYGAGGAIIEGSAVNCTFYGNTAEWFGGAMYEGSAVNCTFSGNSAVYGGGAMFNGYKWDCIGQNDDDFHETGKLEPHWDVNNFTSEYGSDKKLSINLKDQSNYLIGFINCDVIVYKDGNAVKTYQCLSNDAIYFDLPIGIYKAELIVTYPGLNQPDSKNITLAITDGASFWDLNNAINSNSNNIITLDKNYTYNPATDSAFSKGILISRQLTINGQGHTIDAKKEARIFDVESIKVDLNDITFTNGVADNGGAVYFNGAGTITNCNFIDNEATGDEGFGGAVFFQDNGEGNVTNCSFTNNSATGNMSFGGAVYFGEDSSGNIKNCNFTDNKVIAGYYDGDGGAVYFAEDASGAVENCNFTNNYASTEGGAVYVDSESSAIVRNCSFTDNSASVWGGAVFSGDGDVSNCNFTNNYAYAEGGAVWKYSGMVKNCNFIANNATEKGGAVFFCDEGEVENCNFTDNRATGDESLGGAVYFKFFGDAHKVRKCNFTANTAYNGGAVYFYSHDGEVANCTFENNSATQNGGAVYFREGLSGNVTNCKFIGNNATCCGGAVYSDFVSQFEITNSSFVNNSAVDGGGAVFLQLKDSSLIGCNFSHNHAGLGGAVYCVGNHVCFDDLIFIDNYAEMGGAVYWSSDDSSIFNSIFVNNCADKGSAVIASCLRNTVSNSSFLNNRANTEDLEVTKNDNNITIYFTGNDNLLNAIYSNEDVSFTNVTYWGADGIANTDSSAPVKSNREAGQNITVVGVVNGNIINTTKVTDSDGKIVIENVGDYYIIVCHEEDLYYTQAETISTNMKYYVNITSQTTTKKTVNITAKSNIYHEVMPGKLVFILPDGNTITANYSGNGIWWALHTFDGCAAYKVKASYVGLDNVTINNATITVNKLNTALTAGAKTFKFEDKTKKYAVTLKDSKGNAMKNTKLTLKVNGVTYTATTNANGVATFALTKLTKTGNAVITYPGDNNYNKISKTVKLTVKSPVFKTVSYGSKDKAMVKKIQVALKKHGFYLKAHGHYLKVDGIFHKYTVLALKQFQKANKLKVTGQVDYKTAQKLKIVK